MMRPTTARPTSATKPATASRMKMMTHVIAWIVAT
jgi:hypothetical protein